MSADLSFVPAPAYAPMMSGGALHARTINCSYDNLYRLTNGKYCDGLLTQAQIPFSSVGVMKDSPLAFWLT